MAVPVELVQTLINGVLQGGVYAAAAVGLSLIFGVSGILNAAHGELVMLGAFATYWLVALYHVDALLTLPISFALLFAVGWVLQYFVLNRTLGQPILLSLLVTFGVSLILVNVALRLWSADHRMLRIPYFERSLILGDFIVPLSRVAACVVGFGMVAEAYGDAESAREYYARVEKPKKTLIPSTSVYAMAQQRMRVLPR